ncbi:hypothetical protein PCYB_041650 [Plasmodium cynomolgi strain B]|uniref:Uncharacterized protein n=3 Tax=Plasmodium TaxID=5820 RepID=K6UIF8_PLACD|nr:hypothetical protein PCYB_041650 [Plasmodium cynomolgi strain B]XP_008816581.1 hypothetical protein C922_02760 [Plasmodium inui San Antonio 1]XP_019913294.1 Uncharacterized protein PCOAH_00009240 [Plasmodium coatneyi]ANQ06599.1 Uncharacterized protein PCOAH_00009240 [Plasmodium coatneyi]EUD66775.1 hypothetical protein C922_02760 [Plasmodium inui San Antonio 1]GAB64963.1 hypothetical protein PCYB_041650 [Plasmodium cynomolgi strain B]
MSFLSSPSTNHMITNLTKRTNEFQSKIDSILNKISTESLPFQKKSFICCVNCFDTYNTDFETIGKCVNNCQKGTEHFVQVVQNEMQNLQNNLQSCQQSCFYKYSPNYAKSNANIDGPTIEKEMEGCVVKCFDKHEPMLPEISDRLHKTLKEEMK